MPASGCGWYVPLDPVEMVQAVQHHLGQTASLRGQGLSPGAADPYQRILCSDEKRIYHYERKDKDHTPDNTGRILHCSSLRNGLDHRAHYSIQRLVYSGPAQQGCPG